jgi:hypothetical protein
MPQSENQQPAPAVPTEHQPQRPLAEQPWWQELVRAAAGDAVRDIVAGLLQWAQSLL